MITNQDLHAVFPAIWVEWSMTIRRSSAKEIQYTALGKEVTINANTDTTTTVVLVRDARKIALHIKWDDLASIRTTIEKNLAFLDIVSVDGDAIIAPVSDTVSVNNRRFSVAEIDSGFLMRQWKTVMDFPYHEHISVGMFSYSVEENECEFYNSHGASKHFAESSSSYAIELYYENGVSSDGCSDQKYSDHADPVDPHFISALHDYLVLRGNPSKPTITSGKHTITLKNSVVASMLEMLASGLSGENLRQRTSFFVLDELWQRVLSSKITLKSNPNRSGSPFNRLFDSEWVTSEPLTLIEDGVMKHVFLDMKNARKLSLPHTGNPCHANLELIWEASDDYLSSSDFLFTELMALHTVDSISGKFALEGEGFEIVNGQKGDYVKNVSLSGNIRDLFNHVEVIGDDIYTHADIFTPSITFRNQSIVV